MLRLFCPKHKNAKIFDNIQTLSCWYSLESYRWVLSDEYPYARVSVIFQHLCIILYLYSHEHSWHKRVNQKPIIEEGISWLRVNLYASESTQWELSNKYHNDRVYVISKRSLHLCPLDESSLSIGMVKKGYCQNSQVIFLPCWHERVNQKAKKLKKWMKPWHMGTHLKVLSNSYPINTKLTGFRVFLKNLHLCSLDESSPSIRMVKKGYCQNKN